MKKSRRISIHNWVEVEVDDFFEWVKFAVLFEKERSSCHWSDQNAFSPGRRWVFRGQSNASWTISSTLERAVFNRYPKEKERLKIERYFIDEFCRLSNSFLKERKLVPFDYVALMQHYGVPTRLVDFSYSAFIALYFATTTMPKETDQSGEGKANGRDSFAVWAICLDELHEHPNLPEIVDARSGVFNEYRPAVYDNTQSDVFSEKSFGMKRVPLYFAQPLHGNNRSNAQSGVFLLQSSLKKSFMDDLTGSMNGASESMKLSDLCHENNCQDHLDDLIKFSSVIKFTFTKELCQDAIVALRAMNMFPHTLFPDLEGVAKTICRSVHEQVDDFSQLMA